jgi:hypothetical protein
LIVVGSLLADDDRNEGLANRPRRNNATWAMEATKKLNSCEYSGQREKSQAIRKKISPTIFLFPPCE